MVTHELTTLELLKRARERVARGWARRAFARAANGYVCSPSAHNARSWCAVGALQADVGEGAPLYRALYALEPELREYAAPYTATGCAAKEVVASANDRQKTTKRDILAAYDRAIARLERGAP